MSLPYFPLYPDDFEADTPHLTMAEDGAYNRILRLCWRSPGCQIPADEAWLFRKLRAREDAEIAAVRAVVAEFFTEEKGMIYSPRLRLEWLAANEAHDKRVKAGSRGGKAKARKVNDTVAGNAKAMLKQPEPEPEEKKDIALSREKATPKRFEEFWLAYPHRGGVKRGRKPSQAKYERLVRGGTHEQTLIDAARRYASDKRVIDGFAKDPATWLNQSGWEDEVEARAAPPPEDDRAAWRARMAKISGTA